MVLSPVFGPVWRHSGAGWNESLPRKKENPLNSNYAVLIILNCSESLDSHLCGECVLRGLGLSKPDQTLLCNFKKKVTCSALYEW